MEDNKMTRMEMIKNKINSLPGGSMSESNHYWLGERQNQECSSRKPGIFKKCFKY